MSGKLPDHSEIVYALNPLAYKYFELGTQLEIEHQQLKAIENQYKDNQSRCLIEVIALWQKITGECSWSALAKAVERVGGNDNLAKELWERSKSQRHDSSTSADTDYKLSRSDSQSTNSCRPSRHDPTQCADESGYSSNGESNQSGDSSGSEVECFELSPGCGCESMCSLYSFCAGGCPNPTRKRVPVLRKKTKGALQSEIPHKEEYDFKDHEKSTKSIQKSFGDFVLDTKRSFETSNVNIQELTLYLQSTFPCMKTRAEDLNRATCLEEVFKVVNQACSWFDYEIIEVTIQRFGNSTAKGCLEKYKAHFKKYAKQRLPKGMKHIKVGDGVKRGGKQLVIKIDKEWNEVTFSDLDKLRGTFASIFGVKRRDLYLADIQEGCIMMTFMITEELGRRLFLSKSCLTSSQTKSLKDVGVISLRCAKLSWRAAVSAREHDGRKIKVRKKYYTDTARPLRM